MRENNGINSQNINVQSAWNTFYKSGKVQDYLAFAAYENSSVSERQGMENEALHRRINNKRAKGGRK